MYKIPKKFSDTVSGLGIIAHLLKFLHIRKVSRKIEKQYVTFKNIKILNVK